MEKQKVGLATVAELESRKNKSSWSSEYIPHKIVPSLWLHAMVSRTKQNVLSCPGNPTTGDNGPTKVFRVPSEGFTETRSPHSPSERDSAYGSHATKWASVHTLCPDIQGTLLPTGCGHLGPILDSRDTCPLGSESGSCLPKLPSSPVSSF